MRGFMWKRKVALSIISGSHINCFRENQEGYRWDNEWKGLGSRLNVNPVQFHNLLMEGSI